MEKKQRVEGDDLTIQAINTVQRALRFGAGHKIPDALLSEYVFRYVTVLDANNFAQTASVNKDTFVLLAKSGQLHLDGRSRVSVPAQWKAFLQAITSKQFAQRCRHLRIMEADAVVSKDADFFPLFANLQTLELGFMDLPDWTFRGTKWALKRFVTRGLPSASRQAHTMFPDLDANWNQLVAWESRHVRFESFNDLERLLWPSGKTLQRLQLNIHESKSGDRPIDNTTEALTEATKHLPHISMLILDNWPSKPEHLLAVMPWTKLRSLCMHHLEQPSSDFYLEHNAIMTSTSGCSTCQQYYPRLKSFGSMSRNARARCCKQKACSR